MALLTQSRTLSASSTAIPDIMGQPALVPVKLSGAEGLNGLFEYHLDLKTPDGLNLIPSHAANFKLNDFIGRELTIKIDLEGNGSFISGAAGGSAVNTGAGTREITGLITDATLLGESGRFVHYRLTLRPWLHLATENSDCRIYQDKTVVEILDALLGKYSFPVDKRFIDTYPKRDYQTQFNESDYHFFCRLCEEWGINWFFEHSDGKHRLVLIDNMGAHKKNPSAAYQQVPFYPEGHKLDSEYVHRFTPTESITAGSYTTKDYDYTRPKADLTVKRSDPRPTAHNQQEVYEWHADAHYSQPKAGVDKDGNDPAEESKFIARMRMESLRQRGHHALGSGHLRGMVPGCTFALQKHPQNAANTDYLIIGTTLLIEEVAQASQSTGAQVAACSSDRPQTDPSAPVLYGAALKGVGHLGSNVGISQYYVNGKWGSVAPGWGAYGGSMCCVAIPMRPPATPFMVTVKWETCDVGHIKFVNHKAVDPDAECTTAWHEATVPVHYGRPSARETYTDLNVHFLPYNKIEVWATSQRPSAPDYTGPAYPRGPAPARIGPDYTPLPSESSSASPSSKQGVTP